MAPLFIFKSTEINFTYVSSWKRSQHFVILNMEAFRRDEIQKNLQSILRQEPPTHCLTTGNSEADVGHRFSAFLIRLIR